jgi:hypothetical protein
MIGTYEIGTRQSVVTPKVTPDAAASTKITFTAFSFEARSMQGKASQQIQIVYELLIQTKRLLWIESRAS